MLRGGSGSAQVSPILTGRRNGKTQARAFGEDLPSWVSGMRHVGLKCPFSDNPITNRCFCNRISLFSMIEFPVIEKQGIARQSIVMIAVFSGTSMPEGLKQECG